MFRWGRERLEAVNVSCGRQDAYDPTSFWCQPFTLEENKLISLRRSMKSPRSARGLDCGFLHCFSHSSPLAKLVLLSIGLTPPDISIH